MTFTDEDLTWFETALVEDAPEDWFEGDRKKAKAFLDRLRAAEKVVECAIDCYGMDSFVVKQWKKLAGKDS